MKVDYQNHKHPKTAEKMAEHKERHPHDEHAIYPSQREHSLLETEGTPLTALKHQMAESNAAMEKFNNKIASAADLFKKAAEVQAKNFFTKKPETMKEKT